MSRDFEVVKNQGYSLVSDVGWYGTNYRMGPAEREELHRCEMIDALCDFNRRREKKNQNFKGYE